MLLIFILLAVVGVVMILYGIFRMPGSADKKKPSDEEPRVEVVYRVPSVFDRRNRR